MGDRGKRLSVNRRPRGPVGFAYRNVTASKLDLAAAPLSVGVAKRRMPYDILKIQGAKQVSRLNIGRVACRRS